jgi:type IV secretion system protein VirB6
MSQYCHAPDTSAGVALRLSDYLDCQARALGENGFQALAGGPIGMSVLSGLLTIFIALIGYRFILGEAPGLRDGVTWTLRVGFVLALMTSWPAFQTLIYRVAVDGPQELAGTVLPASGLAADGLPWRVQQTYDTIRLGANGPPAGAADAAPAPAAGDAASAPARPFQFQPPMPQTASLFVLTTAGFSGAFRIAVGFLLAVGPLAIMCLLFDATLGIFSGWIRALAGAAIATAATVTVTAINLTVVESELAHLQAMAATGFLRGIDPQGLTTIVSVFAVVMLITTLAAVRMAGAFRLAAPRQGLWPLGERRPAPTQRESIPVQQAAAQALAAHRPISGQDRAASIAEALAASVRRERVHMLHGAPPQGSPRPTSRAHAANDPAAGGGSGPGTSGRRSLGRRTRTATRRDGMR